MKNNTLYLVIPCYNEEAMLPITYPKLKEKMEKLIKKNKISSKSKIIFVNDGSKDNTWSLIEKYHHEDKLVGGINLSRNRGHQNALLCGLMTVKDQCDMVISMDADLQDDVNAIDKFIDEFYKGADIVYGVRSSRKKDTWFKRTTACGFYKFMSMMGVEVVYNHADYRLMSKRVLNDLEQFKEVNLFLRGIFPLIGYQTAIVTYERNQRVAGESKYPLKKMLSFAFEGITSFSVKPLSIILNIGIVILFISILIMGYCLIQKMLGNTVDGWTFITISIWFLGGIQMLALGIIGKYIGKIYSETKQRPRYIIREYLNHEK